MKDLKTYEGIIEITKIENIGDNAHQIGTLTGRCLYFKKLIFEFQVKQTQNPKLFFATPSVFRQILAIQ